MSRIPEKWHDAVMGFSLDIARDSENFPKKVLGLFQKHFGVKRSIFFPYQYPGFPWGPGPAGQCPEQLHYLWNPIRPNV